MKIIEVTLPTTNIDSQEHCFSKRLGFTCKRKNANELLVHCGGNLINFVRAQRQFYFHYCFLIPPGSLAAAVTFLDERNFQPLLYEGQRIVDFGNGRAVYFWDADGNIAEFIERPSLGHPAQNEFRISDVIQLNEIGMPCENPIAVAEELIQKFGISLVDEAVFRNDFVWCGDYEGVFLLPKIGRNWMPCDKACEKNALSVKFETQKGIFEHTSPP